jgi:uncharacterized membrane protein
MQENIYLPGSSERKRAIMTYLLVGLLFFSGKEELTVFEYYHYKQSIGWYTLTIFSLVLWILVFWIPVLRWIPFILVLFNLIVLFIFIFKAWKWEYIANVMEEEKRKTFYADLWGRVLWIFEVNKRVYWDISLDNWSQIDNLNKKSDGQGNTDTNQSN